MRGGLAATGALVLASLGVPRVGAEANEVKAEPPAITSNYPSLAIIGFTDFGFFTTNQPDLLSNSGFSEGQFVLHFTSALSPRFTFFGEVSVSARRDAAHDSQGTAFNAEVERSILKYTQSDLLRLSVGRFHTPIGYWNVAFHHGQWLQTSISRPEMIQFGGQFLPVHFVGAMAEGVLPSGGLNLNYSLGAGNGRSAVLHRGGDAGDVNNSRAWIGGLFVKPDRPFGLQAGASVYFDTISQESTDHRERILAAYAAWTKETPEVIAEFASVRHRDAGGGRAFTSHAHHVQAAYRLAAMNGRWKPYARWEYIRISGDDPVFAALRSRKLWLAGLRFDASDLVALKSEYRRQRTTGLPFVDGGYFQISLSF